MENCARDEAVCGKFCFINLCVKDVTKIVCGRVVHERRCVSKLRA